MSDAKRFVVFIFPEYYPSGGWTDFHDAFDTFGAAKDSLDQDRNDYEEGHVVDLCTGKIVYRRN